MHELIARFEVTTPSFVAGMTQSQSELRPSSLRGVLRFWWRALMYRRLGSSVSQLRCRESAVFGDAAAGSGRVHFLPLKVADEPKWVDFETIADRPGLRYLGYGLEKRKGLVVPFVFDLPLAVCGEPVDGLHDALIVMGLLGGIGPRSRRGWGSLSLLSLEQDGHRLWRAPADDAALKSEWSRLLDLDIGGEDDAEWYPLTALGPKSRLYLVEQGADPLEVLNRGGEEFQRYRSFGRQGKVGKYSAEQNFRADHDLMLDAISHGAPERAPERTIFGLPHNYFFSSMKRKVSVTSNSQRRASPLLFHVQKLEAGYALVLATIPARFSTDRTLTIAEGSKKYQVSAAVESYYPMIERFITGTRMGSGMPRFPNQERMWP